MKVGIEGSLFFKRSTGVGHYAKSVIEATSKVDSDVDFEIVRHWLPFKKFRAPIKPTTHLHYRLVKWFPPAVYYQLFKRFPWSFPYDWIALKKYDAFIFFNFIAFPLSRRTKSIVVIHDLTFVHYPQYMQTTNLKYMSKLVPESVKRADHIITVSENSKEEIVKYFNLPESKVSIVPNAIDHRKFYPRDRTEVEEVRGKYNLPQRYIHFHGTIEPRKNVEGLLNAYAALSQDLKDEFSLVLTGGKGWKDESIYQKIDELKSSGHNVVLPGYIDGEDLPALYSGASLFVLPSFYEGFGIPPLEAMACGVPVITSDNSSLPEVVGDAAIKVKADDTKALADSIRKLLTNEALAQSFMEKGLRQAAKFSWEKSAEKLVDLLHEI
jgi:glycosyltransferase involved in cell wall biosynthesis